MAQFLDRLLKRGQAELAKRTLSSQLKILEKTNPEYAKFVKQFPTDNGSLYPQEENAPPVPPSGSKIIDTLAKNGMYGGAARSYSPAACTPHVLLRVPGGGGISTAGIAWEYRGSIGGSI